MIKQGADTALLILTGLTANETRLDHVKRFFTQRSAYDVYAPEIPKRKSLKSSSCWLGSYLDDELDPSRYRSLHLLGYISGGLVFRKLMFVEHRPIPLDRVVYLRSPNQEYAVARFVQRYGKLVIWLLKGRMMIDITTDEAAALPYPRSRRGQGLVVEEGLSRFARWMGVSQHRLPAAADSVARLLPDAADIVNVPQSHDEIYTSDDVLGLILNFFSSGRFRAGT